MSSDETPNLSRAAQRGCLMALMSAFTTCLMLFVNGSIVWACLTVLAAQGLSWANHPSISQFLLFVLPVLLCLVQWRLIDYVRRQITS